MKYKVLSSTIGALCVALGILWVYLKPATATPFAPPSDHSVPDQSTGGASRSSFYFTPPPDNAAPNQSTGGASRENLSFIPPTERSAPNQTRSGASREAFIPPADNTAPRSTQGAGSRTGDYGVNSLILSSTTPSILAITPPGFYGTTLAAKPTFLTYVPTSPITEAIFSLKDDQGNLLHEQPVSLPAEGGIVLIGLSEDAPELVVGQYYQWLLTVQLEEHLTPGSPFVDAWIKRIEPSTELAGLLEPGDPVNLAAVLAQNGVWYDTVATLATVHGNPSTSSATTLENWQELLTSVELEDMVGATIVLSDAN
ncbi:MAG: DUF928 domain-containing protein [Cyanothece sp. SIO2G6]|nr:DUF928 domain-containing protein [Cyanothece sp. SIO2G6]